MKTKRTPQEKKALSYDHDRRNVYGESIHASRKAIPRHKAAVRRSYRHGVSQELRGAIGLPDLEKQELVDTKISSIKRKGWRKVPDRPLKEHVLKRLSWRAYQQNRAVDDVLIDKIAVKLRGPALPRMTVPSSGPGKKKRSHRWCLDPAEVSFVGGSSTEGWDRDVDRGVWQQQEVRLLHRPTGIEVRGETPWVQSSKKQKIKLRLALEKKLFLELENKVGAHLKIPGRSPRIEPLPDF